MVRDLSSLSLRVLKRFVLGGGTVVSFKSSKHLVSIWIIFSRSSELICRGIEYIASNFWCVFSLCSYEKRSFKVPLPRKSVDPILNATEQHFQMSLNSVFSFSLSRFVFEIFRFSKYAN